MAAGLQHMHLQSYISSGVPSRLCITFSNPAAAFTKSRHIALLSERLSLHTVLTVMRFRRWFGLCSAVRQAHTNM